jgi:putative ABC transport system substrate-binding protein
MKRREALGGAAAWPVVARAQHPAIPVVGLFGPIPPTASIYVPDFKAGVADLGFVEGTTVLYDWRTADGHPERLPEIAEALVQARPAVIASFVVCARRVRSRVPQRRFPLCFSCPVTRFCLV